MGDVGLGASLGALAPEALGAAGSAGAGGAGIAEALAATSGDVPGAFGPATIPTTFAPAGELAPTTVPGIGAPASFGWEQFAKLGPEVGKQLLSFLGAGGVAPWDKTYAPNIWAGNMPMAAPGMTARSPGNIEHLISLANIDPQIIQRMLQAFQGPALAG